MAEARTELRPHRHLFMQGVLASIAFMTPVFIASYVISVPRQTWPAVLVLQVLASAAVFVAAAAYFRVSIQLDDTSITEVGFFGGKRRIELSNIGSLLLVDVYDSVGAVLPQLFVRDRAGNQLLRMRGQFWSRDSMETVIRTLNVTCERVEDPLSPGELRADYPTLLYWFERHPAWAVTAFAASIGVAGALVYGLFAMIGL